MKKFICMVALEMFSFQMLDALQLKQYCDFQEKHKDLFEKHFDSSTDLIRGLIMLKDGVLKEQRHFGNIDFDKSTTYETCSFDDQGKDAMTRLLILTHPSAGGSGFNATGAGSIDAIFKNSEDLMRIIAGMFKLANEVRNLIKTKNDTELKKMESWTKENFLKYFDVDVSLKKEDINNSQLSIILVSHFCELMDKKRTIDAIVEKLDTWIEASVVAFTEAKKELEGKDLSNDKEMMFNNFVEIIRYISDSKEKPGLANLDKEKKN